MASGGEVGGALTDNTGSEDLEDVKCQPCQDDGELREAVGVCTDCQEYLCQRCFDGHKIPRPYRNHRLFSKQEMAQSLIQVTRKDKCTVRCTMHRDKNVKYYCATHGQLSCNVCINLDHRICKGVLYIPNVADDLENNDEFKQVEDQLSSIQERFKQAAEIAEQKSKALGSNYTEALEIIREFRKEINETIDRTEREILEKASEMKSTEMKEMGRADEERERAEKELKAIVARIETLRNLKQNCNLFVEMMKIKNKLVTLCDELGEIEQRQSCAKTDVEFTPNNKTLVSLKQADTFGKLTVIGNKKETPDSASPVGLPSTRTIDKADYSHDIHVKCVGDTVDCWISGSVFLPDSRLLIVDRNNRKIKAVDIQHGTVSSQLKLSSSPWDITTINNNLVVVTLPHANKMDFVKTVEKLAVDRSLKLGGKCYGIDYRDDKLAISFILPSQIKILDLQGTVFHSIQPVTRDVQLFKGLYSTCFGQDSTTVYVSSHGSREVVCIKLDGTVVGAYTDDDLKGLLLDRCGNVYGCAWGSHTIHQLTPDCKKIRVLLTEKDGLRQPYTVSYSESESRLYVGMYGCNHVNVYKVTLGRD